MRKKRVILNKTKKIPLKQVENEKIEHKCKNCLLYNQEKGECKIAILIEGEELHMPVNPEDFCHLEELNIEVDQVRWWAEDSKGKKSKTGKGKIKMEYPDNFFGEKTK